MDTRAWADALKNEFNSRQAPGGPRPIKLPSGLAFGGTRDCAKIAIGKAAMNANMQSDAAAFDGWAFVLMHWLGVGRFHLTAPEGKGEGVHYERFLFRLDRFCRMVGDKVGLDAELNRALTGAQFKSADPAVLNIAPRLRELDDSPRAGSSEADLEIFLCRNREAREGVMKASASSVSAANSGWALQPKSLCGNQDFLRREERHRSDRG